MTDALHKVIETPIEQRIQTGIVWLNESYPDWLNAFPDEPFVCLNSSNYHVLAIVSGIDFNLGFRTKLTSEDDWIWMYERGFAYLDFEEADLSQEWIGQITLLKLTKKVREQSEATIAVKTFPEGTLVESAETEPAPSLLSTSLSMEAHHETQEIAEEEVSPESSRTDSEQNPESIQTSLF